MFSDPVAYDAGLAGESLLTQLAPELSGIVTALLPALLQIPLVLIDRGCMTARPALWKAAGTDPTANRLPSEAAAACDLPL
jgi:hypothetical protein